MDYDDSVPFLKSFEGTWGREGPEGYGTLKYKGKDGKKDGKKYKGQFHCGKLHGEGKLYYKKLPIYEGNFDNNLKHGEGVFVYYAHSYVWDYEDEVLFSGLGNFPNMKRLFVSEDSNTAN